MYCDGCGCERCQNTEKDQGVVMKERGKVLARNPQSFLPKVRAPGRSGTAGVFAVHVWLLWGYRE
jgi:hypothetical protein